ncbi:MAG: helix-turn-helix transcriptional regulator [Candidatus Paceibacteria bacterium]
MSKSQVVLIVVKDICTMAEMDDERYVELRGRYIAKTTQLRLPESEAIAYAERGYSSNGISKQMNVSESTVKDYLRRAMALYGLEIAETLLPNEPEPDYDKVNPDYHKDLGSKEKQKWIEYVKRYNDKLPKEWYNNVKNSIKESDNSNMW